jgi:hypothetical protein
MKIKLSSTLACTAVLAFAPGAGDTGRAAVDAAPPLSVPELGAAHDRAACGPLSSLTVDAFPRRCLMNNLFDIHN